VYQCALGLPARTFWRGLGFATLQPVSLPVVGFPTRPLLGLWETAVAKVLNQQRAAAATQQQCNAQSAAASSVASIYA